MTDFTLHPQLEKDTLPVGDIDDCKILLMNNRQFPWLVVVPKVDGLREIHGLKEPQYSRIMVLIRDITARFCTLTGAHKMNVAALGNVVPQLHIHIIARFESDAAWPQPVWNSGVFAEPYSSEEVQKLIHKLRELLNITKM